MRELKQLNSFLPPAFVAALAAVISAIVVIIFFSEAQKLYKLASIAALIFPLGMFLSGNQRLFFLFGLILTSPLALSINFKTLIHIGGSPSYSIDLTDFFLLPLIVFLLRDFMVGYRKQLEIPPIILWWVGLIILGMIDILLGPLRHLPGFETFRMIKNLIIFIVVINECRRVRHFELVMVALALGVLIQIAVGYLQFLLKHDLGLQALGEASPEAIKGANLGVYGTQSGVYRVSALMGHPNLLSAYLAMLLPIFIAMLFAGYNRLVKILLTALIFLGGILLVITLSRAGWAAFAVAYLVVLMVVFMDPWLRTKHLALKGFLIIFTLAAGILFSGPVIKRIAQSDSGALDFRYEWMDVAMKMVMDKPVFGFGLNTFVYRMAPYTSFGSPQALNDRFGENWPAVHNIYLLIWSEQGTIGLLLFLGFHVHLFRIAFKNLRYNLDLRLHVINIGALAGVIALLVDGYASFFIRVPASGRMFWIVVALIVGIQIWNKYNHRYRAYGNI